MDRWATRQVHVKHYYYTAQRIYPRHKPESIHYVHVQGTFLYPPFAVQMRHIAHSITVLTRPIQDTVGTSYGVLGCSCLAKHCVQAAEGHVCVCVCVYVCVRVCVFVNTGEMQKMLI